MIPLFKNSRDGHFSKILYKLCYGYHKQSACKIRVRFKLPTPPPLCTPISAISKKRRKLLAVQWRHRYGRVWWQCRLALSHFRIVFQQMRTFCNKNFTNLIAQDSEHVGLLLSEFVKKIYNERRKKNMLRESFSCLLMLLVTLKHGGRLDMHWRVVNISASTFKRIIKRLEMLLFDSFYRIIIAEVSKNTTMHDSQSIKLTFPKFTDALKAVNVKFQQDFCPCGSANEKKIYCL